MDAEKNSQRIICKIMPMWRDGFTCEEIAERLGWRRRNSVARFISNNRDDFGYRTPGRRNNWAGSAR